MIGLMPTGTGATTCPKGVASIGLAGSQFGLVGSDVGEHSEMSTIDTEPGDVPFPWLATTISFSPDARSAHTGREFGHVVVPVAGVQPTGIVLTGVSSALVWALITDTVPSVWFRIKARRVSSVITPYTGPLPTVSHAEMVLAATARRRSRA